MKVLVTGANGMLGQDLCPILLDNGYEVIKTDKHNLDVTDFKACVDFLSETSPEIVIHCAAYTNVDKAEKDYDTALKINSEGSENIAKACSKINATLVYISTDYVFDGEKKQPYIIDDKPNPINVYGLTKLKGEEAVKKYCRGYYIIRTSWLYGLYGKNFVDTMLNLAQKGNEIVVVDDQIGSPTWTVDLSLAIIKIIRNCSFGTYHACGSGVTSWYGFAKEIFFIKKIQPNLKSCKSIEYPCSTKRPMYSVLSNEGVCRDWKIALKDYLKEK